MLRQSHVRQSFRLFFGVRDPNRRQCKASLRSTTSMSSHSEENKPPPPLTSIPTLPFFGSLIPAFSGVPALDVDNMVGYFRKLYLDKGPFISMGFPGFGKDIDGKFYIIRDPNEMLKVVTQEGKFPSGDMETQWPLIQWMNSKNYTAVGLMSRGEEWRRIRHFIQKDLLAPASARDYLPGILLGATKSSKKASEAAQSGSLDRYFSESALDMFTEVMFGGNDMSPEDYRNFCDSSVDVLSGLNLIMRDPLEHVLNAIGYKTTKVKRFESSFDTVDNLVRRRLDQFFIKIENNSLTNEEKNSYCAKLIQRQPESPVTRDELVQIAILMYMAGVDSTAAKAAWNFLQLSLHPEYQEKLYDQLSRAVEKEGALRPSVLTNTSEIPLLSAFIRETHRCTPVIFADLSKRVAAPTTVYGVELPAESTIMFDSLTYAMDPTLVDDPLSFRPERWLKDEVEARKGTPSAIIDHPFYSGPFSQGARRCPGSRVAYLEVQAIIARLVLDWQIEGPTDVHWSNYPTKQKLLQVPVFSDAIRLRSRTL